MVEWSGKPAYQQVAEKIRERISAGEFSDAGQIPSLSQLQSEYGVSVTVVREAVRQLRGEGLVVSHQGKAAFLTDSARQLRAGAKPTNEVAQLRKEVADLRGELQQLREQVTAIQSGKGVTEDMTRAVATAAKTLRMMW